MTEYNASDRENASTAKDSLQLAEEDLRALEALIAPERVELYKQDQDLRGHYSILLGHQGFDELLSLRGHEANSDETKEFLNFFSRIERQKREVE